MKNCFKKILVMFVMVLTIALGSFINVFATDINQSTKINNETLNFNKIIYVDGAHGDDLNGDGSKVNPVKSLTKATSIVDTNNTLIYMLTPGTYEVANGLQSLLSSNYALTYTTSL
ncbi:DUF1565 domain-containing protein [Clostridium cagae]|uniref:DUF1565 domain-containing protein n=1 Tax=Clostridium cagae TaxID=2080751 RepID=UPI003F7723D6